MDVVRLFVSPCCGLLKLLTFFLFKKNGASTASGKKRGTNRLNWAEFCLFVWEGLRCFSDTKQPLKKRINFISGDLNAHCSSGESLGQIAVVNGGVLGM